MSFTPFFCFFLYFFKFIKFLFFCVTKHNNDMIQGCSAIKCVLAVESFYFGFLELNDWIFGGVMCECWFKLSQF